MSLTISEESLLDVQKGGYAEGAFNRDLVFFEQGQ